jgi:uncharacterized protein YdcH (DUF465 family)
MSEKANTRDMKDVQNLVRRISSRVYLDSEEEIASLIQEYMKSELSSKDAEIAELKADKVKLFDEMHNVVTQLGKYLLFRHPEELMDEIKSDKEWINIAIQRLDSDDLDYIQSNLSKTPKP